MWGENSHGCENNCQCDGLITENFTINSGNSATKRKQEAAATTNFKLKMNPHSITFPPAPTPPKRTVLGVLNMDPHNMDRLSNIDRLKQSPMDIPSPKHKSPMIISPLASLASPLMNSPIISTHSPLTTRIKGTSKIAKINQERTQFMMDKENFLFKNEFNSFNTEYSKKMEYNYGNCSKETYSVESQSYSVDSQSYGAESQSYSVDHFKEESYVIDMEETARDFSFGERFQASRENIAWSPTKLDFSNSVPVSGGGGGVGAEEEEEAELHALAELEEQLESDALENCSKYEIISTDSPDVISRGRESSRKITSRNFTFGAPLSSCEPSTSFPSHPQHPHNPPKPRPATRMLNFDEDFEFTSPSLSVKKTLVKKSLKFEGRSERSSKLGEREKVQRTLKFEGDSNTPVPLRHERSDSSIGSMSEASPRLTRIFTSDSTTSMESGFISEMDEPFLDLEESSSPKIANFNELLSGTIKDNILTGFKDHRNRKQLTFSEDMSGEQMQDLSSFSNQSQERDLDSFSDQRKERDVSCFSFAKRDVPDRVRRPALARSLSFHPESKRVSLLSTESPSEEKRKREDDSACGSAKRRRPGVSPPPPRPAPPRPALQRAFSENNASIKSALARSMVESDLVGDYSRSYRLPRVPGDHSDLASISPDTLDRLLRGDFADSVPHYQIIDCRYPYEFDGGHIESALNLHRADQLHALLRGPGGQGGQGAPRHEGDTVLIFHCEYSIERGPKLARTLRSLDRAYNKARYPALAYPEVYLLAGGYRALHAACPARAASYTSMRDPRHHSTLRRHRSTTARLL